MTDYTPENLNNDQIITLLQMLFTNMNNLDQVYYDLFINTIPMDITLERYDENGTLHTYIIPNRAKDQSQTYLGQGNPEGVQDAKVGSFYLDVLNSNVYVKISQTERYGWYLVYTSNNFQAGIDYLAPNGDGSGLTNLNGSNISSGIISASVGGTGTNGLTGILKGNGGNPCTVAIPNVDYATPTLFTGMIGYFAGPTAPDGWLIADGEIYSTSVYPNLATYLNGYFNDDTEPIGYFRVPNLQGMFIRGYDINRGLDTTNFTANLTYGTTTITNISGINFDMFAIGLNVTGDGIPNNTTITTITSNSIVLSNGVTASGTKTLTLIGRRFGSYQQGTNIASGGLSVSMWNYDGYPSGGESVPGVRAVSMASGTTGQTYPTNVGLLTCIKY